MTGSADNDYGRKLIELKDISVSYDRKKVLEDVSLRVDRGDFLAITGPNGGGKTTLLKVLLKLLKPTTGEVIYYDSKGEPARKLAIGYLPQKSAIDTRFPLTVAEVVRQGQLRGFFRKETPEMRKRYEETAEKCGLLAFEDKPIGALSGGQLQRTLLARAIVSRPEVLVLDEPLSYVDKQFEHQIYSMMEELARQTTIILVSHEMSVISQMANRHILVERRVRVCHSGRHYSESCE